MAQVDEFLSPCLRNLRATNDEGLVRDDIAGWDTLLAVGDQLIGDLDASQTVPRMVMEMVDRGELGVKTGKGFYDWTPETGEALRQRIAGALLSIEKWSRTVS